MVEGVNNTNLINRYKNGQNTSVREKPSAQSTKTSAPVQKPDSVEISSKQQKLTKKQQICLGIALGLLGAGLFHTVKWFRHAQVGAVKLKELAPNIEFKKGETLKEAIEFGKKHLGIKEYKGFEKADIDVINWINEGLVKVSNFKNGKLKFPDIIEYSFEEGKTLANVTARKNKMLNTLKINKNFFGNVDERISESMRGHTFTDMKMFSEDSVNEIIKNLEKFKKKELFGFNDKLQLYENLEKLEHESSRSPAYRIQEILNNPEAKEKLIKEGILKGENYDKIEWCKSLPCIELDKLNQCDYRYLNTVQKVLLSKSGYRFKHEIASPFRTIFHEIGHLQYKPMKGTGNMDLIESLDKYWNGDRKALGTALTVSRYAATSPSEFLAEVFAEQASGHKLSDEVIELCEKIINS